MESLLQDLRLAVRRLSHSPGFTFIAIATLAIGIGASTSVFGLVNAIRFKPLPFEQPTQLADLSEHNPAEVCAGCSVGTSYPTYLDWKSQSHAFADLAAYRTASVAFGTTDGTEQRRVARVSGNLFSVLGVSPIAGRVLSKAEDQPGAARVAMIGAALWRARFGGDSNVVGKTVRIDGETHQIIGIMPDYFAFPEFAEVWLPIAPTMVEAKRNERSIGVVARLAPEQSMSSARAEMTAIARRLETAYPTEQKGWTAHVTSLHDDLARDYAGTFGMMLGAVACVLVIACANLANLMLARATTRRGELAVRAALGASRAQLGRQFLIEVTLIAVTGGVFGLILSSWGSDILPTIKQLAGEGLPLWIRFDMDWRVFLFAFALSLLTGFAFGGLAARYATKTDLNDVIKEGGRNVSGGRSRTRGALVVLQVATALVLVTIGGLLAKAMMRGRSLDIGYELNGLIRADIGVSNHKYRNGEGVPLFASRIVDEVKRATGAKAAGLMGLYIVNWPGTPRVDVVADGHEANDASVGVSHLRIITPEYFDALGAPLVSGRAFIDRDVAGSMPVAIVNQTLARSVWPAQNAVGQHIRIGATTWTIIGVAPDFQANAFSPGTRPLMYLPLAQQPQTQPAGQTLTLYARVADASTTNIAPAVRSAVWQVDLDVTVNTIMTERAFMERLRSPYQAMASLAVGLGLFACLLAAIGIYGVIAYFVGQRTQELGIRTALGATPTSIVWLVLKYGLTLSVIGIVIGGIAAAAVTRLVGFMLFGVSPTDPVVFAAVSALFVGVALLAAYLPARRATRADPMLALRAE